MLRGLNQLTDVTHSSSLQYIGNLVILLLEQLLIPVSEDGPS